MNVEIYTYYAKEFTNKRGLESPKRFECFSGWVGEGEYGVRNEWVRANV